MAINIIQSPDDYHPIFHPVIWLLDSDIKSSDQFRYLIILTIGVETRTIEISPRPGDGYGWGDISQHLRDFLDQDIVNIKQQGATLYQKAAATLYDIQFSEKYKDVSGNEVIVAGPTVSDRTGLNTIFKRHEWLFYVDLLWKLNNAASNFLWNIEDGVEVFKDDIFFIHIASPVDTYDYVIEEHFKNGTSLVTQATINLNDYANLFRFDLSILLTDPDNAVKICIKFKKGAVQRSKEVCLNLIDNCSIYTNHKFLYLDDKGSYNSLNFNHKSRKVDSSNPKAYKKFNDDLSKLDIDRHLTRYFNNPTEVHTVNTDYLTDKHNVMMVDLINSERVFLDVRNDPDYPTVSFYPVEILTKTIEEAKSENMDLAQFTINWRFSFDKIGR